MSKPYPIGTVYYRYKGRYYVGKMPHGPYTEKILFNVEGDGSKVNEDGSIGIPWRPVPGIKIEPKKAVNAKYTQKSRSMIDNVRYKK